MLYDKNHSKQFERYLKGEMSPEEAHDFERQLLDDPFAKEALEGYETQGIDALRDLHKLRSKVRSRKLNNIWWKIAAAIALLITGTYVLFMFTNPLIKDQLALDEESIEETIEPPLPDTIAHMPKMESANSNIPVSEIPAPSQETSSPAYEPSEKKKIIEGKEDATTTDEAMIQEAEYLVAADDGAALAKEWKDVNTETETAQQLQEVVTEPITKEEKNKPSTLNNTPASQAFRTQAARSAAQPAFPTNEKVAPQPLIGDSLYRQYLITELVYPKEAKQFGIEGVVILELTINTSGEIENINIKRSLGYGCDEEAIRLVKEGPKWSPAKNNGNAVVGRVKIEIDFSI